MSNKDFYSTLGVSKSSSDEEIKKSYKKLAFKYHPDRNKGDKKSEEKFKEINEAYQVLGDSEKDLSMTLMDLLLLKVEELVVFQEVVSLEVDLVVVESILKI